jgi:hypothetical protein
MVLARKSQRLIGDSLSHALSGNKTKSTVLLKHDLGALKLPTMGRECEIALGLAAFAQGREIRFFCVSELIMLLFEALEEKQLTRLRNSWPNSVIGFGRRS